MCLVVIAQEMCLVFCAHIFYLKLSWLLKVSELLALALQIVVCAVSVSLSPWLRLLQRAAKPCYNCNNVLLNFNDTKESWFLSLICCSVYMCASTIWLTFWHKWHIKEKKKETCKSKPFHLPVSSVCVFTRSLFSSLADVISCTAFPWNINVVTWLAIGLALS